MDAPRVTIDAAGRRGTAGTWTFAWRVANDGERPLRLERAQLPHGRFHGAPADLHDVPDIAPGTACTVELGVRADGRPGEVVENAFVILQARYADRPWRILARLEISFDDAGAPVPRRVHSSTQPVGFSTSLER